jgi:hypothetical protein
MPQRITLLMSLDTTHISTVRANRSRWATTCAHATQNGNRHAHNSSWVPLFGLSSLFLRTLSVLSQPSRRNTNPRPASLSWDPCAVISAPSHTRPLPFFGVLSRMLVGAPWRAPPNRRPMQRPRLHRWVVPGQASDSFWVQDCQRDASSNVIVVVTLKVLVVRYFCRL